MEEAMADPMRGLRDRDSRDFRGWAGQRQGVAAGVIPIQSKATTSTFVVFPIQAYR
jgi:hypothetical protein